MNVAKIMKSQVKTIQADASFREAADKMHKFGIRHLPVMKGESLAGILSERDMALVSVFFQKDQQSESGARKDVTVEEIMSPSPVILSPRDSLERAMEIAIHRKFGAFPVMDDDKLVGIITTIDLLRVALDAMQQQV